MQKKYKMTGCAKFFIFLLFAVPAAYFASAIYHGEDGLGIIKDKLGKIVNSNQPSIDNSTEASIQKLEDTYQKEIKELKQRIKNLEEELDAKNKEISDLKETNNSEE